jgi:hypothetical protein
MWRSRVDCRRAARSGYADVAELVDALASGASVSNDVEVQVLSSAPYNDLAQRARFLFRYNSCMTERFVPITWQTREAYEQHRPDRLLHAQLVEACKYLMMFEVMNGTMPAASTTVEFVKQSEFKTGPTARHTVQPVIARFYDSDFQMNWDLSGEMNNGMIRFVDRLLVKEPGRGTMDTGYVLPHDGGLDAYDQVFRMLDMPLVGSVER